MNDVNQDVADLKAWRKVTEPSLRELAADTKSILAQVADINAKLVNHQTCPAPAQCNALEIRVRGLENSQLSQTSAGWGIWKTISVIAVTSAAAPLSVAAVVEVIKILHP